MVIVCLGTALCIQLKVIKACSKEDLAALSLQPPGVPVLDLAKCHEHQTLATRLEAIQVRGNQHETSALHLQLALQCCRILRSHHAELAG